MLGPTIPFLIWEGALEKRRSLEQKLNWCFALPYLTYLSKSESSIVDDELFVGEWTSGNLGDV